MGNIILYVAIRLVLLAVFKLFMDNCCIVNSNINQPELIETSSATIANFTNTSAVHHRLDVFQNFDTFTTDTFSAWRRQKQQLISMIVWENVFVKLKKYSTTSRLYWHVSWFPWRWTACYSVVVCSFVRCFCSVHIYKRWYIFISCRGH